MWVCISVISATVRKLPSKFTSKCMFCWSSCWYSAGSLGVLYPCPMRSAFRTSTACKGNMHYGKGWQKYSDTRACFFFVVWHFEKWAEQLWRFLKYLPYDLVLRKEMYFTDRISSQNQLIVKNRLRIVTQFSICTTESRWTSTVAVQSTFCVVSVFLLNSM